MNTPFTPEDIELAAHVSNMAQYDLDRKAKAWRLTYKDPWGICAWDFPTRVDAERAALALPGDCTHIRFTPIEDSCTPECPVLCDKHPRAL